MVFRGKGISLAVHVPDHTVSGGEEGRESERRRREAE